MSTNNNNIYTANYQFNGPFELKLADGEILYADKVVRIIPKRRMVVFGTWQDKSVVAKLFFDSRHAKKHVEKDRIGVKALQNHKVPTPDLYYDGTTADKRCQILLFEKIEESKNLNQILIEVNSIKNIMPSLKLLVVELATQHVLGVLQHDLHFKNFIQSENVIYTLDGGQVEIFPQMLSKKQSMNSIALLLSQLGVGVEKYQIELYRYYAKSRGWLVKAKDVHELFKLIKRWDQQRWRRYEKKIERDCTDFSAIEHFRAFGIYDRAYAAPEFLQFMQNPEAVYQQEDKKILKLGRSSTVIKITLDQHEYVIKRYNMKNIFHYLRRCLRETRAATSWRLAQKLKLFRIPTAPPVAFIETRFLGLRGKSYYITEYVPHLQDDSYFARHAKRVVALLKNLAKLSITHGDLKISNILVDTEERPLLIDLDGAAEHSSRSSLHNAWRKEIKRLLKNFDDQPLLQEQFKKELI